MSSEKVSGRNQERGRQSVEAFLESLRKNDLYRKAIAHHEYFPPNSSRYGDPDPPLPERIVSALRAGGIGRLYSHQVEALQAVRDGSNVIVSTPTASGKTLIYNLPVLERYLADPRTRALYIYPLKALEQDQQRKILGLSARVSPLEGLGAEIYDGDTSAYRRRKIRAELPNILITNPDMLHLSILGFHESWEEFFRDLRYVVVDELHTYKGIFGAHFAGVLRRLRRLCALYGSTPVFIASSATIANPGEFAGRLFEAPFTVVDASGAPSTGRHFLFINHDELRPSTVAARLIRELVDAGLKTIAFTKSRKSTELIHSWLIRSDRRLAGRISSYRAGFLPSERREIESSLAEDRLDAVVSTSALEMGIDIGGLDACLLVGYPGTVTQTWQRGGRVGRSDRESLVILIAQQDALDQYFMRHPDDFFRRGCERAIVDPDNEFVLRAHLECAAAELPLGAGETVFTRERFGGAVDDLLRSGVLLQSASGDRVFCARARPQRTVNLRATGEAFSIMDLSEEPAALVGSVGGERALSECHPGAVYLHRARQYLVQKLDLEKRNIYVAPFDKPYYTQVMREKDTEILETLKSRPAGNFLVKFGHLKVTETITGFQKRSISTQELLSSHELELPPRIFETMGLWIELPGAVEQEVLRCEGHFMGGLHAIEHATIAIFPLFVLSDRDDIGGICFPLHPQVGGPAIFIYDGYPGGVGIARSGFDRIEDLLEGAFKLIGECECETGCPSCVHSPKCGSGNKPLDKPSALLILEMLLAKRPLPQVSAPCKEKPGPGDKFSPDEKTGPLFPTDKKILVFDLETQRSAEEVGGWGNKYLMRLSAAVIQDLASGEFLTFTENDVDDLLGYLAGADLVVGFNILDFDYQVLSAYGLSDPDRLNTFDILKDIHQRLGYRLSLGHLAAANLGAAKLADGIQAIQWYREGKMEKIIEYCSRDVAITARLFEQGLRQGFLVFEHKQGEMVKLPLDWNLTNLLE